jgi:hypothetical protein
MSEKHAEGVYRVFWDFYGPSAKPTAEHFLHHLNEMISREGLTGNVEGTGVEMLSEGWCATWCDAPLALAQRVGRSLNAKRAELKRPLSSP